MSILTSYTSRKYSLAFIATSISAIGLFTGHLTGSEWVTAQSIILGLYGASNVAQKATGKLS